MLNCWLRFNLIHYCPFLLGVAGQVAHIFIVGQHLDFLSLVVLQLPASDLNRSSRFFFLGLLLVQIRTYLKWPEIDYREAPIEITQTEQDQKYGSGPGRNGAHPGCKQLVHILMPEYKVNSRYQQHQIFEKGNTGYQFDKVTKATTIGHPHIGFCIGSPF